MVKARSFNLSLDLGSENQKRFNAAVADILAAGRSSGELRDDVPLGAAARWPCSPAQTGVVVFRILLYFGGPPPSTAEVTPHIVFSCTLGGRSGQMPGR